VFVTCGSCKTEYELDDAKIPAGGARLRCTNCKNSFVVTPPEASDLRSADDLAHDAISAAAQRRAAAEAVQDAAPDEDSEVEADWQFNDEIASPETEPEPDPEPQAGAGRPGFSLDMLEPPPGTIDSPFGEQGDDWSDLSLAEEAVDDLLGAGGPVADDAAAAVDDLLGEMDTSSWGAPERDSQPDSKASREALELADEPAPAAPHTSAAPDASAGFEDLSSGLEDLSDLDVFDSIEESAEPARSSRSQGRSGAASRDGARSEPQVKIAVAMARTPEAPTRWTDRLSVVAGWIAVGALVAFSLVEGLAPHSGVTRAQAGSWSGAGFEADQIVGRWVDNAVAGSIYVVSGRVRRASGSASSSQDALGIALLDANGHAIDRPPAPLAPSIPDRVLREASPTEIAAFQQRRAGQIAAVGGRWSSFEVVLSDLPSNAGRFELQALDR
jgi:predicted Zn finger-like uncharacterized protein